jgi:hypothetical protein
MENMAFKTGNYQIAHALGLLLGTGRAEYLLHRQIASHSQLVPRGIPINAANETKCDPPLRNPALAIEFIGNFL